MVSLAVSESRLVVVIPAAGRGTRHAPVSSVVPKELLPVGGRPLIDWALEGCREARSRDVVIVESPTKPLLRRYLVERWALEPAGEQLLSSSSLQLRLRFVEQPTSDGMADALWRARASIAGGWFAMVMPDWVHLAAPHPLAQLLRVAESLADLSEVAAILALCPLDAEAAASCSAITGALGDDGLVRIEALQNKGAGPADKDGQRRAWRGSSAALVSPRFLEIAAEQRAAEGSGELDDVPIFQRMLREGGSLLGVPVVGTQIDAGNQAGYARAHAATLGAAAQSTSDRATGRRECGGWRSS